MHRIIFSVTIILVALTAGVLTGCQPSASMLVHEGQALMAGKEYGPALDKFNAALAKEPTSNVALFGKACCTYELRRFEEALPLFEQFLAQTEEERAVYSTERYEAEFDRDKCKQELGMEVPQNPDAIPPPRMGE